MAQKAADRVDGCEKCGEAHRSPKGLPQCVGHVRSEGGRRCRRSPIRGGTVCSKHGGSTPQLREKIERQRYLEAREGEIAQLLEACDLPNQHPIEGLLEVVRHSGQMYRMLGGLVSDLKTDPTTDNAIVGMDDNGDPVYKPVYGDDGIWGVDHNGNQVEHVLVALYEKWTGIYARACKMALDAGIDERRVQLAEQTTETMFTAVTRALAAVALSPSDRDAFTAALAAELRTVGVESAKALPAGRK